MKNIFFLDNQNYNKEISLVSDEKKEIFVIDTIKNNVDFNLNVRLSKNCNFHLVISSLNQNDFTKTYNVKVFHDDDSSFSKCEVFGVNKNMSKTKFFLEAIIKDGSLSNYAEQKIRGILLSNDAQIEGKPNLIINTNNIKAKHALAIGSLNVAHLFYLQNKGIPKNQAIKLLLLSYFNVILYKIDNEQEREKMIENIFNEIGEI